MQVFTSVEAVRQWRQQAGQVGLVPTMGYLHDGHRSLIQAARAANDAVIVSIFVNPTQFAAGEDFSSYPRDSDRDLTLLRQAGVEAVFMPEPATMYPADFQTSIHVDRVTQGREGGQRPGHFIGVATVVCKLLSIVQPTSAYFGQKDAQQVAVVRRMVADLNLPYGIVVCPIVREADGLAMSSRNVYLTPPERRAAHVLSAGLQAAARAYEDGERQPQALKDHVLRVVATEPQAEVAYVDVSLAGTLAEAHEVTDEALLVSLAVRIGRPRLLDNLLLPVSLNTQAGATQHLGQPTP